MNEKALECINLTKTFKTGFIPKPVCALGGLSFSIPKGSVTGLLGPNGSGKSTFLKIATDFVRSSSGEVRFFNGQKFSEVKKLVGYVPEKPYYFSGFSGFEILKFHASLTGESKVRVTEIIDLIDMSEFIRRPFRTYSKGMRQRLAIGQALLSDPELLILDEPLSGLDPDGREALIQVILNYAKEKNKTVLLSSHLLEDLQRICTNLVVLNKGKVIFSGNPEEVFSPEDFYVSYRKKSFEIFKEKVSVDELNLFLSKLLENNSKILSVEPEVKSFRALYFKLIKEKV